MRKLMWLIALVSCGSPAPVVSNAALLVNAQSAKVSDEQAQLAYEIIAAIDYIPFTYTDDGCYARALYMAMELATRGLPSSAQFLEGELSPDPYTSWWYHVALMLLVGANSEPTVVDPSLAATPLPLSEWVPLSHPAPGYRLFWVPGSVYASDEVFDNSEQAPMIESLSELPMFRPRDLSDACKYMHRYIGYETELTWPERDAKRARLLARTRELLSQLAVIGKVNLRRLDCGEDVGQIYP